MQGEKYTEDKTSISLMQLNKFCKDEYYESAYKFQNQKLFFARLLMFLRSVLSVGKYGVKKYFLKIFWTIFPKRINNYELTDDFNDKTEFTASNVSIDNMPKVVVYTSVFGNYDKICEPLFANDKIKYIAITDQEISPDSVWEKYDTASIDGFDKLDAYHKSKYCKLHPHKLFPTYDFSIWVDGNVQIVADLLPLILRMDNHFMATFKNPCHNDIYTEARFCVYHDAVDLNKVTEQMEHYKKDGFPKGFGMREFSIIIRQHNINQCINLMEQWWSEVNTFTMRDQLSFPYLLWKNNLTIDTIQLLGGNWRFNPRFIAKPHKTAHSYITKK